MSLSSIGKIFAGALGAKFLAQALIKFGGASTGFAIGFLVFDALFPERPGGGAGALADLHYMGSAYGTPWPKIWGDARVGGQISYIHKDSLGNDFKQTSSGGSKKSPSGPTYTFTGFVGFCQASLFFPDNSSTSGGTTLHRNQRIVQIWANQSELIYEEQVAGVVTTNPYHIVLVHGTETQAADSDVTTLEGLGSNTPAMRSICGAYLKNFPTKKFGDTIPQLSARIKTDAVTTGNVISDLCQLHGIKPSQFDVSLCTDPMTGMVWNSREQGRNPMEQILVAYDIDLVEVDGMLKFIPRSAAATYDIDQSLLGASSSGMAEAYRSTRKHPSVEDRPTRVSVFYLDPDSSFNQNTSEASRQSVYDGSDYSLSTTLVLTSTQAEALAMRLLDRFWLELDEVTISLPTHGMIYAPGDNLRITIDGVQTKFRITQMVMAPLGEVKIIGTVVDDDTLSQVPTGSSGNGGNPNPVSIVPSSFTAFSSKEVRDEDQATAGFYVAASGDIGWQSGQVWYLPPGATEYIEGPVITSRCTFGVTTSALGSSGAVSGSRDLFNSVGVDVSTSFAALQNREDTAVDQGNNWAWLGDEIIGYSTATLTSTYHYTLSTLLRGERSSTMTGHTSSDRFVLIDSSIAHIGVPDSHVGLTYQVKVLSGGQLITDVTAQPVVIVARTPTALEASMSTIQSQINGLASQVNTNEHGGRIEFEMIDCQCVIEVADDRINADIFPKLVVIQNAESTEDFYTWNVLSLENGLMTVSVAGSKLDGKPIKKSRTPLTLAYMVS